RPSPLPMMRVDQVDPPSLLTYTRMPLETAMSLEKATRLLVFVGLITREASLWLPATRLMLTFGPTVKDGTSRSSSSSTCGRKQCCAGRRRAETDLWLGRGRRCHQVGNSMRGLLCAENQGWDG